MRVTKRTKTTLVLPLLTTDEKFMKAVESVPLVCGCECYVPGLYCPVCERRMSYDPGTDE